MKTLPILLGLAALLLPVAPSLSQTAKESKAAVVSSPGFDANANEALTRMRAKAEQMGVTGVAVVAYFEGSPIQSWTSKMLVVGQYRKDPTETDKGSNLLGIAYAKASEMADTLKDSGTSGRPPLTGEFGWNGGVIGALKHGYFIVAFSGGKSEDDVLISKEGLATLKAAL
jgi:hypothetical protein